MTSHIPKNPTTIGLLLHDVTDAPCSSGFKQPTAAKYKHSVKAFREYLNVVQQSGLPVIGSVPDTFSDLSKTPQTIVQFTFDDGGAAALATADLLDEKGWKGLFFITTGLIGTLGFMTSAQVQELDRRGHTIGSHSCTHPDVFRQLDRSDMRYEWRQSREVLEDLLGHSVNVASVPGGDCDNATIEEASAAGLNQLYTSEQVTKPWTYAGVTCYGRLMMLNSTTPECLKRWLTYPRMGILPERALRFTKTSVKKLMGPMYVSLVKRRRRQHGPA